MHAQHTHGVGQGPGQTVEQGEGSNGNAPGNEERPAHQQHRNAQRLGQPLNVRAKLQPQQGGFGVGLFVVGVLLVELLDLVVLPGEGLDHPVAGDILLRVDGKDIQGENLNTVVSYVKGEKGTEVDLTVLRDGEEVELTAVRDTIEVQTVEYEMMEGQIGYISVSEFDEVTYEQFSTALNDLESQDMKGLVIDVRNNPGGNVETVTDMLKLLLPEGPIMSTKDKEGNTEEITCDGAHEFKKPLAVLVNGNSASASEIFSGAIQDYGIGTIVGTTTYGKGVVQQLIGLGDGTYLKLTIAEYYTPSGRSINGTGVTPDVEVEYEYDENDPEADNQLEKALETVEGQLN